MARPGPRESPWCERQLAECPNFGTNCHARFSVVRDVPAPRAENALYCVIQALRGPCSRADRDRGHGRLRCARGSERAELSVPVCASMAVCDARTPPGNFVVKSVRAAGRGVPHMRDLAWPWDCPKKERRNTFPGPVDCLSLPSNRVQSAGRVERGLCTVQACGMPGRIRGRPALGRFVDGIQVVEVCRCGVHWDVHRPACL